MVLLRLPCHIISKCQLWANTFKKEVKEIWLSARWWEDLVWNIIFFFTCFLILEEKTWNCSIWLTVSTHPNTGGVLISLVSPLNSGRPWTFECKAGLLQSCLTAFDSEFQALMLRWIKMVCPSKKYSKHFLSTADLEKVIHGFTSTWIDYNSPPVTLASVKDSKKV